MDGIGFLTAVFFLGLAVHAWWQLRGACGTLGKVLDGGETEPVCDPDGPEVGVVLCLKGADPFLEKTFRQLATQDYARYRVLIVVDSEEDEACEAARRAERMYGGDRFRIIIRHREYAQCSRRASSLLSALEGLADEVEIVVLCDGDAVVPRTFLGQLVRGLSEKGVMAVSGNRWYVPSGGNLASFSRYYWNALAVPAMEQFGIPWAGSLAFRSELFRSPGFRKTLRTAFSEDTAIAAHLRRQRMKYKSLPLLKVVNQESTTLSGYWGFLVRQMLAVKLHHPDWGKILVHGVALGVAVWVLLPLVVFMGPVGMSVTAASVLVYATTVLVMVEVYDRRLRGMIPEMGRAEETSMGRRLRFVCGMVMTALVYPLAVMRAWTTRTHCWRGIRYRVGKNRIQVVTES